MSFEKRELPIPSVSDAYVTNWDKDKEIRFLLNEDGEYTLNASEFYSAFNWLFSIEFRELIEAINRRENAIANALEYEEAMFVAAKNGTPLTDQQIYDALAAERDLGFHKGICHEKREQIIEQCGWGVYIDVVHLYETFTGTPREWVA